MKRRNVEANKFYHHHRRSQAFHFSRKYKLAESIYQSSTFIYLKFFLIWLAIMLLDFLLEFRFEFLWPIWLLMRSLNDSLKYQGILFSLFFALIVFFTDLVVYLFLPMQWLVFAASTYVWVQYVWHTEKGVCLPTISLWLLFVYIEASLRLGTNAATNAAAAAKNAQSHKVSIDLCRPFAAHCIGYPMVTLGFGFKSYLGFKLRLKKQKEIQKSNEFYLDLIGKALPAELQLKEKEKFKALNYEEEDISNGSNQFSLQEAANSNINNGANAFANKNNDKTLNQSKINANNQLNHNSLLASALSFYLKSNNSSGSNGPTGTNDDASNNGYSITKSNSSSKPLTNLTNNSKSSASFSTISIQSNSNSNTNASCSNLLVLSSSASSSSSSNNKEDNSNNNNNNNNNNQTNININMTINTTAIAAAAASATSTSNMNGSDGSSSSSAHHQKSSSSSSSSSSSRQMSSKKYKNNKENRQHAVNTNGNGSNTSNLALVVNSSSKNDVDLDLIDNDTDCDDSGHSLILLNKKLEEEMKKMKLEIEQQKSVENYLRNQINYITKCDRTEKLKFEKLQQENENLQSKVNKLSLQKQKEKEELMSTEKKLQEEKRQRQNVELQLSQEKKQREHLERQLARQSSSQTHTPPPVVQTQPQSQPVPPPPPPPPQPQLAHQQYQPTYANQLTNSNKSSSSSSSSSSSCVDMVASSQPQPQQQLTQQPCCTEFCRKRLKEFELENKFLNEECKKKQDKNVSLQESLSAETRFKLDLFSALGEARRQLEACYYQLETKERELTTYRTLFTNNNGQQHNSSIMKSASTATSNTANGLVESLHNDLIISQYLASQLNTLTSSSTVNIDPNNMNSLNNIDNNLNEQINVENNNCNKTSTNLQ